MRTQLKITRPESLLEPKTGGRLTENRYRELVDMLSQIIFEFDKSGKVTFTNRKSFELFGYSGEDLRKGLNISKILTSQDGYKIKKDIQHALRGETLNVLEYTARKKNGSIFPIVVYILTIVESEKVLDVRGIAVDVSEQKNTEETLKESRDYLDKIINLIADPIFVKDRQHRWVMLNDAYCQFMGYQRPGLLGRSDFDFFPKEEADVFWEKDEAVFQTGKENVNKEKFTDAKGVTHTIVTKKTLYTDNKGKKLIVGVIRDITELKWAEEERIKRERAEAELFERNKAQEALKESEEKYRTLVENLNVGVYRSTADFSGRFLHANLALVKMHGYESVEEFMRVPVSELYQDSRGRKLFLEELCKKGFIKDRELSLRRKDGSSIIGSCTAKVCYDEKGAIKWIDGVLEDITERKRAEAELEKYRQGLEDQVQERTAELINLNSKLAEEITGHKKAEAELQKYREHLEEQVGQRTVELTKVNKQLRAEITERIEVEKALTESEQKLKSTLEKLEAAYEDLQQLDKMKSDFISIVSHELRTPLTSIKNSAAILLKGGPRRRQLGSKERELLSIISNNTDRQTRTINDLLDIAKIESRAMEMEMAPTDIVSLVKEVVDLFELQVQGRKIKQNIPIFSEALLVMADQEQLRRVFTNLIDNAVKFTPDNGQITVTLEKQKANAVVTVTDNGIGISQQDIDRLFNKFYRAGDIEARKRGGTGLGLVIAKGIIEAHGGKIWVESETKRGSSFHCAIPIYKN